MPRRGVSDAWAIAVLIAVISGAYSATLRPGHDWGGDFSQYISHARNLALGRPYAETRYEITLPEAVFYMPPSYPPVFPMLLAPVYGQFGLHLVAMKILVQALFVLGALTCYAFARLRGLDIVRAATAAAAFALSGLVLSLKDLVLSDSTYVCFAGMTLCALTMVERNAWDERKPLTAAAAVALLMLLGYGSRSIGAALAIAFVIHEVAVKRRVRRFNLAVLVVFTAGVVLSGPLYDTSGYSTYFPIIPSGYLQNAIFYLQSPTSLWTGSPAPLRFVLAPLASVIVVIAWVRRMVSRPTVVEVYVAVIATVTIAFALARSARYLLPVFALYFVYFFEGVAWIRERFRMGAWISPTACSILIVGCALNLRGMEKGPYLQGPEQETFIAATDFIRRNVDRDALIVSWNPRLLALYTDRRSAWYPEADATELGRYLDRVAADYVLVYLAGEEDARWLTPHIARDPERFTPVFKNDDFVLYQRRRSLSSAAQ